jgi:hypothetical protein
MTKTTIQPRHEGEGHSRSDGRYQTYVRLARVNAETLEDNVFVNTDRVMQVFVVGIGWEDTYISASTRREYSTYSERMSDFRVDILRDAHRHGDNIIEFRTVTAHSRQDVVKIFDINNTNALSGKNSYNREKFFAAKHEEQEQIEDWLFQYDMYTR